jgi:hypothetical protein
MLARDSTRSVCAQLDPWLSPEHPDPNGWHLEVLARLLSLFVDNFGEAAVFIDFWCARTTTLSDASL